jgi:hypothetical protein
MHPRIIKRGALYFNFKAYIIKITDKIRPFMRNSNFIKLKIGAIALNKRCNNDGVKLNAYIKMSLFLFISIYFESFLSIFNSDKKTIICVISKIPIDTSAFVRMSTYASSKPKRQPKAILIAKIAFIRNILELYSYCCLL